MLVLPTNLADTVDPELQGVPKWQLLPEGYIGIWQVNTVQQSNQHKKIKCIYKINTNKTHIQMKLRYKHIPNHKAKLKCIS